MSPASALAAPALAERASSSFLRAHWELFVLPVVVMLVVIPQYGWPIDYNEAMFVVFGREILEGGLPYRDVFDQKPPLIYYFYALVQGLTGDGFMVARALIFGSLGLTSILVALVAREFYQRRLAFVAGLAFALSSGLVAIAENAGLDQLTLLPLTASIYAVMRWRQERSTRLLVLAGVMVALASLLKPVALPTAVLLAGLVLFTSGRLGPALLMTGAALFVGAFAVLGVWAIGVLPEAYDATIIFGREYSAAGWESVDPLPGIVVWGMALSALLLPATASLVTFIVQRSSRLWLMGGLTVAAFTEAALPGRFYAYYATLPVLPLALLAPGIFEWAGAQRRLVRLGVLAPGAFMFGLAAFVSVALLGEGDASQRPTRATGAAIAAVASTDDRIWVRANRPEVYYYAGLRPAHRYFIAQGIRATAEGDAVADLTAAPPAFIVIDDQKDFAPLLALLEARYDVLTTEETPMETLIAYRRRD